MSCSRAAGIGFACLVGLIGCGGSGTGPTGECDVGWHFVKAVNGDGTTSQRCVQDTVDPGIPPDPSQAGN